MIQILGIFLKDNKSFYTQIQKIYGISSFRALFLCKVLGIDIRVKVKQLQPKQIRFIKKFLETHYILGRDLKKHIQDSIERLSSIGTYRGTRHRYGLPVRGQRTRTNARTRKRSKNKITTSSFFVSKKKAKTFVKKGKNKTR